MALPFYELDEEPDDDELAALEAAEALEIEVKSQAILNYLPQVGRNPKAAAAYRAFQGLFKWRAPACQGVDSDIFFPERGASTKEAKSICEECFARTDCLEYALEASEKFGIWGGTSERERRRLRRERAARKKQADIEEAKALEKQIGPIKPPAIVPPVQLKPAPVSSPVVRDTELSEEEADWFKKLTANKSRSEAIYASYKSGTHLAKSDQLKPVRSYATAKPKPIRPRRAAEPKSITQPVRRYPAKAIRTETRMADTSNEQQVGIDEEALTKICAVLDQMGGKIHNEKGFATRKLREHGLDYSSLNADLQMAEEANLIWRDMSTTRTYEIKLTDQGQRLAGKQAGDTSEEGSTAPASNNGQSQAEMPGEEVEESGSELPLLTLPEQAHQLYLQTRELGESLIGLGKQLDQSEQDRKKLEARCAALSNENTRLKQILSSFRDNLQEVLAEEVENA